MHDDDVEPWLSSRVCVESQNGLSAVSAMVTMAGHGGATLSGTAGSWEPGHTPHAAQGTQGWPGDASRSRKRGKAINELNVNFFISTWTFSISFDKYLVRIDRLFSSFLLLPWSLKGHFSVPINLVVVFHLPTLQLTILQRPLLTTTMTRLIKTLVVNQVYMHLNIFLLLLQVFAVLLLILHNQVGAKRKDNLPDQTRSCIRSDLTLLYSSDTRVSKQYYHINCTMI